MAKRRAHGECGAGGGKCEVVVGASCGGAGGMGGGSGVGRLWMRRRRRVGSMEVSLVMWVIGLLVMSFIVNLCVAIKWVRQ